MIKTDKAIYRTRTQEEYDWLMRELEEADCYWIDGKSATQRNFYGVYSSDTCIWVRDKTISYADISYYRNEPRYECYEFIEVSDLMPKYQT